MGGSELLTVDSEDGPRISVRSSKAVQRGLAMPGSFDRSQSDIQVEGQGLKSAVLFGTPAEIDSNNGSGGAVLTKGQPIFFDQTDYMFELIFPEGAEEAHLFSPISRWCELCDWNPKTCRLHLPVNFGNDLGYFELVFEWRDKHAEDWRSLSIKGRVFSTKLDVGFHVPVMIEEVQQRFDWLRLDLLRSTLWDWGRSDDRKGSLQSWLAIFREVRTELSKSFLELTRRHRRNLTPIEYRTRPERIRRVPPRLEERIAERLKSRSDSKFLVSRKHLDSDIPENRYMKHLLASCVGTLSDIGDRISTVERFSDVFKDRLSEWEQDLKSLLHHPFWRRIGRFRGLQTESLVLSQDPLYARVRRYWIHLQQGVSLLDRELSGGVQNVAQLYEVWCLVKLDRFISTHEDWVIDNRHSIPFERKDDDFDNDEGRVGTVKLGYTHARFAGVELDLLFQPTAGRQPDHKYWDGMMSLPETQCPDLVLRIRRGDLPGSPVFTWIFDAKYRIAVNKDGSPIGAPRDAIDSMHRYRDAILWAADSRGGGRLSRESLGAFVLYPGRDCSTEGLHQLTSVDQVNIGAFSLHPAENSDETATMKPSAFERKLDELISVSGFDQSRPWRVGETQHYYSAVPRVRLGAGEEILRCAIRSHMESESYWKTCRLYRLPVKREADVYKPARSWGYIVPTGSDGTPYGQFPILNSAILRRSAIVKIYRDMGVFIDDDPLKSDCIYRLFWLDEPLPISKRKMLPEGRVVDIEQSPQDS